MKETITRGILQLGTVISAVYVLALGLFLLAPHISGSLFRFIQAAGILSLLASPLGCLLAGASLLCSFLLNLEIKKRLALAVINGVGVFVTGWFTLVLFHLARMGPINPG